MTEPILTYPDPNLPYVLFTDASKYTWACVLTQEKDTYDRREGNKNSTSYHLHEWTIQRKSKLIGHA